MSFTRRQTLGLGLSGLVALGTTIVLPRLAFAQDGGEVSTGDVYPTDSGEIVIHPVEHASFVLEAAGVVIYVDPVGGAEAYGAYPAPDLILITHEHGDHFDVATIGGLAVEGTKIIANPAVVEMLDADLQAATEAAALANGESTTFGDITIDAIPAYNTTEDRLMYHPQGRDNGYILGIEGRRVYIAGDTEDTPEMRALTDIDIAFVPMNLPFTMDVNQAASGVAAFAPGVVYPYHYGDSDLDEFERLLGEETDAVEVVRGAWYPEAEAGEQAAAE